jgi:hypothetical protein
MAAHRSHVLAIGHDEPWFTTFAVTPCFDWRLLSYESAHVGVCNPKAWP